MKHKLLLMYARRLFRTRTWHSDRAGNIRRHNSIPAKFDPLLQHALFDATTTSERLKEDVKAYYRYIGQQVEEWDIVYAEVMATIWNEPTHRKIAAIIGKVLWICRGLEHTQVTIDDVVTGLYSEYMAEKPITPQQKATLRQIVFACIGWATMLYTPVSNEPNQEFCILSPLPSGGRQSCHAFDATYQSLHQTHHCNSQGIWYLGTE